MSKVDHASGEACPQRIAMRDEYESGARPLLPRQEELPYECLRDGIEHGGYLIGNEVAWLHGDGAGDAEPLELSAGELVRVAMEPDTLYAQPIERHGIGGTCLGKRMLHA